MALKVIEHKDRGVEINDLSEQLRLTGSAPGGLAAVGSEGKPYSTTLKDDTMFFTLFIVLF